MSFGRFANWSIWRWHARSQRKKARLDRRLRQLGANEAHNLSKGAHRPYPRVFPKYRNPNNLRKHGQAEDSGRDG
jgi:hypothetical protein